jgi:hypothetical protein
LPSLPKGSRIVPSSAVVGVTVAGQVTLIEFNGGRRITLQRFGGRVWALLVDRPTLPILLERLRRDGGRPEQIAADATHLLAHWRQQELIEWR